MFRAGLVLTLLWSLGSFAAAPKLSEEEKDELSKAFFEAAGRAKLLSAKGDYEGAAKLVASFRATNEPKLESYTLRDVVKVVDTYERRAEWAKQAASSAKAARSLLRSLLFPEAFQAEEAKLTDARISSLFATLRRSDPEFAEFFKDRTVKVSATASVGVDALAPKLFLDELKNSLELLGFKPSDSDGEQQLSFELGAVKSVDMSNDPFFAKGGGLEGTSSCGVKAIGKWQQNGKEVLPTLDLSTRTVAFTPDKCGTEPAKKAGRDAALKIVALWFKAHPTPL